MFLPAGMRGLAAGGILTALMNYLFSVISSCSTLFTIDIYQKLKPEIDEKNWFS
jgi:SSS family solute:Na+ symporter|tara:strand:+ start:517 stop:678 length:162 start_codon:yes stop_codon:yes gene_type:complete